VKLRNQPARRAAELTRSAFVFREQIINETLAPDAAKSGPLCMKQFPFLFNCTRIPTAGSDTTRKSEMRENSYVIAIRGNKFYKISGVDSNGDYLSTADLQAQFDAIYKLAEKEAVGPAIGLFTTENRDNWTDARNELLVSPVNVATLDTIERAAFVVCLDDTTPVTRNDSARACMHGNGQNR
jgi:carnitine O-acetyltransferase